MRQEKIKLIILWALTALCMAVIFWLSSRTADESSAQSNAVLEWIYKVFGENGFTTFIVRKLAHCLEFTGLSVLFNLSLWQSRKKLSCINATVLTALYAITDEIHQIFVEGRSCELRDWAIDCFGAALGTVGFLVLYFILGAIIKSVKSRREKKIDTIK